MAAKTSIWFDGREYRWNDAWNDYVLYGGDDTVKYQDAKRLRYRNDLRKTILRYAAQGAEGIKGIKGTDGAAQGAKGIQGVKGVQGARPAIWHNGYKYEFDDEEGEYVRWVKMGDSSKKFTLKEAKAKEREGGDESGSTSGKLTFKGFESSQEGLQAFDESLKELQNEEDLENEKKDVYSLIAHLCDKWNQESKDKYPDKSEFEENRNKAFAEIGATYGKFLGKIDDEIKRRKEGDAPKTEIPAFEYNGFTSSPDDLEKYKKQIEGLETSELETEKKELTEAWLQLTSAWRKENQDKLSKEDFIKQKMNVDARLYDEMDKFSSLVDEELKRRKEQESAAKEALKNHEFTFAHNGFEPTPEGLKAYAESLKTMPKSDLKKEYLNVNHSLSEGFKEWSNEAKKYWKSYEITEFYNNEYEPLRGDAYDKFEAVIDGEIERREKEVNDIAISLQLFSNGNHFALDEFGLSDYRRAIKKYSQDDLKKETETIQRNVDGKKDAWNKYYKRLVQNELQDEYEKAIFARFDEYQKKFEDAVNNEIARRQRKANLSSRGPLKVTKVEPYNPDISSFPEEFAGSFEVVDDKIGGSTGAKLVKDANGAHYIMKRGTSEKHIVNEARADAFYQAAGVKVPAFKLYDDGTGAPVKISAEIKNTKPLDEWWDEASDEERSEMQKKIRKDFAVDVLMGNWDVVGDGDVNILVDSEGTPWRIDNGCSMGFRGRGDRKPKEMWGEFCDDLFTMTGNGAAIGKDVWTRIPEFFGEMRPLDLAIEIASRDWTRALATLSDVDAEVVKKRLTEIRQIAERGAENEKFGRTKESTDEVIAFSYQMCKDGVREAFPKAVDLNENNYLHGWKSAVGWFYHGNEKRTLNGKEYDSFNEYLAEKMGERAFNYIGKVNLKQGGDSYNNEPIKRKICILKQQGIDCLDPQYSDFADFHEAATNAGFYCGLSGNEHYTKFEAMFNELRNNPSEFDFMCKTINQYDAAIQLVLENVQMENADPVSRTFIVCRNENVGIICDESGTGVPQPGERTYHRTGACDSHCHIESSFYLGEDSTAMEAPFSRFHGLWWIERGSMVNGVYQPDSRGQYNHEDENEASVDSHGLPKVFTGGKSSGAKNIPFFQDSVDIYKEWARNNPDEVITGAVFK